ncbi:MAG: hypothetical protein NW206_05625 [Hyphomonadaceae bacterium]|nr:hypothetical protein [Hyphomonadaceae bacterium]
MIGKAQRTVLKRLAAKRTTAELKQLFALVRAHDDRTLLAAIAPAKKPRPKQPADALLAEVEAILQPLLARSSEKAELLLEHMGQSGSPRGLADAIKKLRAAALSDAQIRKGAKALMADLARDFDGRETVV